MPQLIDTFQIMLGSTSKWDAVSYVRSMTEDISPPYTVPDSAYMNYAEEVAEDFSRWVPLDVQLGDPSLVESPFITQSYVGRYVCNVDNGFTQQPVSRITDLLYQATNAFSAASEISYLALLPFSPLNRFLFTPSLLDSPSERILRDEYLAELDHYGRGYYGVARDPSTGLPALDLYPEPTEGGTPIYVRYQTNHAYTTDSLGNFLYPTVPEANKRHFARLLYAMVLEQEAERFMKSQSFSAGIVRQTADTKSLMARAENVRQQVYQQLGDAVSSVMHTF